MGVDAGDILPSVYRTRIAAKTIPNSSAISKIYFWSLGIPDGIRIENPAGRSIIPPENDIPPALRHTE